MYLNHQEASGLTITVGMLQGNENRRNVPNILEVLLVVEKYRCEKRDKGTDLWDHSL